MAEQLGKEAKFKYNNNTVGNITSLSLSMNGEVVATNNFDTGKIRQALLAGVTITYSISGQLDHTDTTGQNLIRSDYLDAGKIRAADFSGWSIEPETPTAGDRLLSGTHIVSNYSEERSGELDLATYSIEGQIMTFDESDQT